MRATALAFLLLGCGVGFGGMHYLTKDYAAKKVQPVPKFVPNPASSAASRPPLDAARVKQLQETVQGDPKHFEALVELGNIHFDQQNYGDAVAWYRKALEVQPRNVTVRTDMGTALFYSKQIDAAITELRKSLELNPTHPQTLFNLGVALLEGKNDPEAALETWERLVASNPNFPQVSLVKQQIEALRAKLK